MTTLSYLKDSNCLEFKAEVIGINPQKDGSFVALLSETYFYPTGGGQEHDVGCISDANVIDVIKQEDGKVYHILDKAIPLGENTAKIDAERRIRNMQAHSAQHILSRSFEYKFGFDTLSSSINYLHPSTIDLNALNIPDSDLREVENMANRIVFDNLPIRSYYVSNEEITRIPLRRPPKVSNHIRVVEIDGFDYSACGGTHCGRTGSVGLIKIIKSEIQNKKFRIHFLSGSLALEFFQLMTAKMKEGSRLLETSWEQLDLTINKIVDNSHQIRIRLADYRNRYLDYEKEKLLSKFQEMDTYKLITGVYDNLDQDEIRYLANSIRSMKGYLVVLASVKDSKLAMVVGCSRNLNIDARQVLNDFLANYMGKGGGDESLAQGGGKYSSGSLEKLDKDLIQIIARIRFDHDQSKAGLK
ncbi:DHHA1 domain-containing protein [Chloroflexota bacterium]